MQALIKRIVVSPAITKREPRVYVEVMCSFSYLWASDKGEVQSMT